MNNRTILNKVKELLGMEVKLEQRKLEDGVTVIEADEFAPDNEVMIVTEDLSLIHISEPTRPILVSRMPSSA